MVWTPPSQGRRDLSLPFLGSRCEFCTQLQRSGSSRVRGGPAVASSCGKNEEASGGGVEREGRSAEGASKEEARGPAPDLRPQTEGGARWEQAEAPRSNITVPPAPASNDLPFTNWKGAQPVRGPHDIPFFGPTAGLKVRTCTTNDRQM